METDTAAAVKSVNRKWGAEDLLQAFPLHRACRDGDLVALSGLLGDAVVSVCDAVAQDPLFGWSPAHWAAHNGKVECLELLVQAGLPCDISTQGAGLTLAHVAALEGQAACLAWLCKKGVRINAQDHTGETAAHKAVRCGSVECLHILRESGADFGLGSAVGATILDLAVQNQQGQCVDYLRAGGDASSHMTGLAGHGFSGGGGGGWGRRKRLPASKEEEEMGSEVAKRARVDSDNVSASVTFHGTVPSNDQGMEHSPLAYENSNGVGVESQMKCAMNDATRDDALHTVGTVATAPPGTVDGWLMKDYHYAAAIPCCQPIFSRKPYSRDSDHGGRETKNGYHGNGDVCANGDDGGGDALMACEDSVVGNGCSGLLGTGNGALSGGVPQGNASGTFSSPLKARGGLSHSMTNGAVEHKEMVRQSRGYETKLLEAMYNYDAMPCSHAY